MSSINNGAETCLRAGWIFKQKTGLGKSWQKKWAMVNSDGSLTLSNKRNAQHRRSKTFNLRRDCMYVWTGSKCPEVLPPKDRQTAELIQLLLTGDRRVSLCALSIEEAELWFKCIEWARSETELPTPRTTSLDNVPEVPEDDVGCCFCHRSTSKIKAIDYRPSTKHSTTSSIRRKRRVSWSKHVTMIDELT